MKLDLKWRRNGVTLAPLWLEHGEGRRHHSLCSYVRWAPGTGRLRHLPKQLKVLLGGVCCGVQTWAGYDSMVRSGLQVKCGMECEHRGRGP